MNVKERAQVMEDLRANRLDAIVHVGMLGEGFDHPQLSVCGIFCRFSSMPPFVQLVGRILRRIPGQLHPGDSVGYVIAHPGLGLERLWKAYKRESPTIIATEQEKEDTDDDHDEKNGTAKTVPKIPAALKEYEGELTLEQTVEPSCGSEDKANSTTFHHQEDWFLSAE